MGSDLPDPRDQVETALVGRDPAPRPTRVLLVWDGQSRGADVPPGGSVTIGRSSSCELPVDHPSVSRRHAVVHDGAPPELEDLGSSNGTRLEGRTLPPHTRTPVPPGSVVELGDCVLLVQAAQSRAPAPAPAMARAQSLIEAVAPSDLPILLVGETGVGKEVAAERVHAASARAGKPLIKLNCAAVPEALLESELFGHERGAFSGAFTAKPGLFEAAHGGTLFLDEIGELALSLQAKLLRALESGEVPRLGATSPRRVDVRIVCATNRDLPQRVAAGNFREDLYFRINGITIALPALRERRDEILPLAARFLVEAARGGTPTLTPEAERALLAHDWPGNVRELKNTIARAVLLAKDGAIRPEHLQLTPATGSAGTLRGEMDDAARRAVVEALARADGNQTKAAKLLGISRRALLYRLEGMDLPRPRKKKL